MVLTAALGACAPGAAAPDATPDAPAIADASPSDQLTANPLLSRGRPVTSSEGASSSAGPVASLVDGAFLIGDGFAAPVDAAHAPWVAIDLGAGPSRILVTFLAEGEVAHAPGRTPVDYHLETSPDGATWHTALTVTGNDTNARAHAIDFTGQAHVRLVIDRAGATGDVHLIELEAYDASRGTDDTWLFLGDSITAMAMNRYVVPDLATRLHAARPDHTPLVIDAAIGGSQTSFALAPDPEANGRVPLDTWIARFPDVRNVVVAYGTNDAGCDPTGAGAPAFAANLGRIVDTLRAAGKRIVIPHIPWNHWSGCAGTDLVPYDAAIDALRARDVLAGPDLTTYFTAHPDQLFDGVHPDDAGVAAINQLWADALAPLYP